MNNIFTIIVCSLLFFGCRGIAGSAYQKIPVGRPAVQTRTSLRVQADLYFGDEDEEKEAVEADFYLLDESLINILKRAKFKPVYPDEKKHRAKEEDYLQAAAKVLLAESGDEEADTLAFLLNEAVRRHQASFARTNRTGRGYFKAIRAGDYHLFGVKKIENQIVVWHLPISIKSGVNSVELDQNNVATIFSSDE